MSTASTVLPPAAHPPPAPAAETGLPDVVALLQSIIASPEPAVVFSSVAQVCVPRICSSIIVAIADERGYVIENQPVPRPQLRTDCLDDQDVVVVFGDIRIARTSVVTEIHGPATASHCAYEGVLVLNFSQPKPTQAVLGQLIVDRANALIDHKRQIEIAETHRAHAEHLTTALRSSRDIGMALGIIMSRHQLTEADAFDVLRISSQDTQRKVRQVAQEVALTGHFEIPERAPAARPSSRLARVAQPARVVTLELPTPC
jgi:hypothetical protein